MRQPDRADIHFRLAQALERLEHFDDAHDHYRKAVALIPDEAQRLVCLGALEVNDFDEVKHVFRSIHLEVQSHQAMNGLNSDLI
ncbi:MAG: tetratricopeptide repeat protein [Geminicoccales bacterium]